ncbi:uncharacterized protein TM35_000221890 [Trypanosoma theileri]|uniref:Uncharacterized protein n=1 Tax=Trypanosoma theileri TaxID=67003 RepID=A0A1X0NTF1_9TRYP|nr:uncharacterized protein TM35_000221890 [Trypanosoma theileri]ORC87390.1 hypothetical protein TM35_000221890 [Trypanosoma theileri]
MKSSEKPSGCFSDVPYCSPIESSVFFETLGSARIHRVSESMMTKADSIDFFIDRGTQFCNLIDELKKKLTGDGNIPSGLESLKFLDVIPTLFQNPSVQRIIRNDEGNSCFVTIESKNPEDPLDEPSIGLDRELFTSVILSLDLKGIDFLWQSLILFLMGDTEPEKDIVYILPNINIYLRNGNSYGGFLFSLWALVISSILHHFTTIPVDYVRRRLNRVRFWITVLRDSESDIISDNIHLFFENKLRICVYRILNTKPITYKGYDDKFTTVIRVADREEWLEKTTEIVVNTHEELCDTNVDPQDESELSFSCILLIIPEIKSLRRELEKRLCDSYTSVPISVVTQEKEIYEGFSNLDRNTPITIFYSEKQIEEQLLKPEHERYLKRLNIKAIIVGEESFNDRSIVLIRHLIPESPPPVLLLYPRKNSVDFKKNSCEVDCNKNCNIQEAINLILWLFRRFRFDLCVKGIQPVLHASKMFFISTNTTSFFNEVLDTMKVTGLVRFVKQTDETNSFRLEILGRAISYRFRLPYEGKLPELTPFDVKCILWCHALRQSKITANKLISNVHSFPTWVEKAIDFFCSRYRISLQNENDTERETLVKLFSSVPKNNEEISRVKLFLMHPSGERLPILNHFIQTPSTLCRGWYEQAPIGTDVEVSPKPHVSVYCYPSYNELCEVHFGDHTLQCPLDISYPLIATHIALHTTILNNSVFLEYNDFSAVPPLVPMPLTVLQNPTLNSFLDDFDNGNVGYWLDNCMNSSNSLSDGMELASLMARTSSLLGICDRGALRRKRATKDSVVKRQKCEINETPKPPSEAEAETIREFVNAAKKLGRENAEKRFKGKRGFGFLNPSNESHAFYLYILEQSSP